MRKDLGMRKGKMISQGAHASMKVFFDRMRKKDKYQYMLNLPACELGEEMARWIDSIFTKITCGVKSEEELLDIYNKAKEAKLPCSLIQDAGKTEFKGVPTNTCCAIGPANEEAINKITGELSLL